MPQLNPNPWMAIFVFTWLVFLMLIPTKVLGHTFTNPAQTKSTKKSEAISWTWPWY